MRTYPVVLAAALVPACMAELQAFNVCVMANVTVAKLQGVVQDISGRRIADAKVELLAGVDHHPVANTTADINGSFSFAEAEARLVLAECEHTGFSHTDAHIQVRPRSFLLFRRPGSLVWVHLAIRRGLRRSSSINLPNKGTKARPLK